MGLEVATHVSELVSTNPIGAADDVSVGDDHLRLIKAALQATFPAADHAIRLERPRADVASGATTNIGAATTNYVNITGVTTITAFDTVAAGIWRFIRFDAILTFTHNATSLILPGATNITTAAGDHALAVSLGSGNWAVLFYQRASGGMVGTVNLTSQVSGILPVANGGTGQATEAEALGEMTQALTEDTAPDRANDFVMAYDASADTGVKVKLQNVAAGWAQLVAATAFSGSSIDINISTFTAFRAIKVLYYQIDCSADTNLDLRLSDVGTSSFASGVSDYGWAWMVASGAGGFFTHDLTDSSIDMGFLGSTSVELGFLEVIVWNPASAVLNLVEGKLISLDGSTQVTRVETVGTRNASEVVQGIQLLPSTGTFAGTFTVYGLV